MAVAKLGKKNKLTKEELEAKKAILRIFTIYPDLMISKLSKQAGDEGKLIRKGMLVYSSTSQPDSQEKFNKLIERSENEDEFSIDYSMTFGTKNPVTGSIIREAEYRMNTNIKFEEGVSKLTVLQNTTFSTTKEAEEKYKYLFELMDKENNMIKTLTPDELVKYVNDLVFNLIQENVIN